MSKPSLPTATAIRNAVNKIACRQISGAEMDGIIHSLIVSGGDTNRRDYRARHKPATLEATKKELLKVADLTDKLYSALDSLHEPGAACIADLDNRLASLHILSIVARAKADDPPELSFCSDPSPQEEVAYVIACVFNQVTGKPPTVISKDTPVNQYQTQQKAGGAFFNFLDDIFTIRGITASRETSANKGRDLWNLRTRKPA